MPSEIETVLTPDDFSPFAHVQDANLIRGINIGLDIEMRSRAFYQSITHKLPADKRLILKFLANEELDHYRTLLSLKTALQRNGNWLELTPKQRSRIRPPRLYEGKGSPPDITETGSETDVILAAMKAEQRAEQFYKRVQKRVTHPSTRLFFETMARFERGHYNILKGLLSV